jgi:hypothetical protein
MPMNMPLKVTAAATAIQQTPPWMTEAEPYTLCLQAG